MKRTIMLGATLATLAAMSVPLTGCGGGGGTVPNPPVPPSGYVGTYTGSVQSTVDNGSTTFTIDSTKSISGTVKFSKLSSSVPITGSITDSGALTAHYSAGGYAYTVYGPLQQSPLNKHDYTATLAVHNDTTGGSSPSAALTVTRS